MIGFVEGAIDTRRCGIEIDVDGVGHTLKLRRVAESGGVGREEIAWIVTTNAGGGGVEIVVDKAGRARKG